MPSGIYKRTVEHNRNNSKAKKGKKHPNFGKHYSAKHRKAISDGNKGKPKTAEHCQALSDAHLGIPLSAEHRQGIKDALNKPEVKQKRSQAISDGQLGSNPEYPNGTPAYFQKLSRKIYELVYGEKIPKGMDLHHKDGNWANIDPENLELRSRSGHMKWHRRIKPLIDKVEKILRIKEK